MVYIGLGHLVISKVMSSKEKGEPRKYFSRIVLAEVGVPLEKS